MERRQRRIDWGEAVVPGLVLVFGLAYFFQTRDASWAVLYWPLIVAVLTGILLLGVVFKFVIIRVEEKQEEAGPGFKARLLGSKKSGLIFLGSVGYVCAVPFIGFSLSNFIFMQVIFRGLGSKKWIMNILTALGLTVFLHVVLIVLMKLSLPQLMIGPLTI